MKSRSVSQWPTEVWLTGTGKKVTPTPSGSPVDNVVTLELSLPASPLAKRHTAFDALMAELEGDPASARELQEAGVWVADTFYDDEGDTLRVARLRKGLSQKQLAALLGTSQPHIVNLEKGTSDPQLSTVQKLCAALDIELNSLPAMLERQRNLNDRKCQK